RADGRSVPPAFRAVLRRCLAPDPADRYASAAELAADLQAVADAAPLRFTREPMASRVAGWIRRNRPPVAVAAPIFPALLVFAIARDRRASLARRSFDRGEQALAAGNWSTAAAQFATAAAQADPWLGLGGLARTAMSRGELALEIDAFHLRADPLRFHL